MGETPESVSCPDDLPAEEDASMDCEVTLAEETVLVTATVRTVANGSVFFDLEIAEEG